MGSHREGNTSAAGVSAAIAGLRSAVAVLAGENLSELSDEGLLAAARLLRPVVCQVQAAEAKLIGVINVRGAGGVEGAVSTTAWLRGQLHLAEAPARVRSAALLLRCPRVNKAFTDGRISR